MDGSLRDKVQNDGFCPTLYIADLLMNDLQTTISLESTHQCPSLPVIPHHAPWWLSSQELAKVCSRLKFRYHIYNINVGIGRAVARRKPHIASADVSLK